MADIVKSLGRVSLWAVMIGLGSVTAGELSSGWKAGVVRVDTTPHKPVRMAGYASRTESACKKSSVAKTVPFGWPRMRTT